MQRMSDPFSIARSGLAVTRSALTVTSENIANQNTEGYRRRSIITEEVAAAPATPLALGARPQGVIVSEIRRAFDTLLTERVRNATGSLQGANAALPHLQDLETRLLSGGQGPVKMLEDFFASLGGLSADAADQGLRRVVLERGQAVASSIADMGKSLGQIATGIAQEFSAGLVRANANLRALAELETEITNQPRAAGRLPLLDRRDALITDLAGLMDISVTYDARERVSIRFGSAGGGPLLLEGGQAARMEAAPFGRVAIYPVGSTSSQPVIRSAAKGQLQGLAEAAMAVGDAQTALDGWAAQMARDMNGIHESGTDYTGARGQALFALEGWDSQSALANRGTAAAFVTVADATALPRAPLTLVHDGQAGEWLLQDQEGETLARGAERLSYRGLLIDVEGRAMDGDRITLTPVTGRAQDMAFLLRDPATLAAAAPRLVSAAPENRGTGWVAINDARSSAAPLPDLAQTGSGGEVVSFLQGGAVGMVPEGAKTATLVSFPREAALEFGASAAAMATALSLDFAGSIVDFTAAPPLGLADFADALNAGLVTSGMGESLADFGLRAALENDRLILRSHETAPLPSATLSSSEGGFSGQIIADPVPASAIRVFTREGQQLSGPALSASEAAAFLTEANGFLPDAIYRTDHLNADGAYGGMQLSRISSVGDAAVMLGREGGIATATAPMRPAPTLAQSLTVDLMKGDGEIGISLPVGSSAKETAATLEAAMPLRAMAETRFALTAPQQGQFGFALQAANDTPVLISVDMGQEGLIGLANALNMHRMATGVEAVLSPDATRLEVIAREGHDVALSALVYDPMQVVGITRLDPQGENLGQKMLDPAVEDSVRVTGTVTLSGAEAFRLREGAILRESAFVPALNGWMDLTRGAAGAVQDIGFSYDPAIDGARGARYGLTLAAPDGVILSGDILPGLQGAQNPADVARGLAETLRKDAPHSTMRGAAMAALPPLGAQMRFTLGTQDYRLTMQGSGPVIEGPEPWRITAAFDGQNRLQIATIGGHLDGAALALPADAGEAARFGLGLADVPQTSLIGQPPDLANLPASFTIELAGQSYQIDRSAAAVSAPIGAPLSATLGPQGETILQFDARLGQLRIAAQEGARSAGLQTYGVALAAMETGLRATATDHRNLMIAPKTAGSLQVLRLGMIPQGEGLIVALGLDGDAQALRMGGEVEMGMDDAMPRPREIRVLDAAARQIGLFDQETGAMIATRSLDANGMTEMAGLSITLGGGFATGDRFVVSPAMPRSNDGAWAERLADLQRPDAGQTLGGYAGRFADLQARVGAQVSSAQVRQESAQALHEGALKAEAALSAVDLDAEAAALMAQQQAYQANAQVMSVAKSLFDTLMNIL